MNREAAWPIVAAALIAIVGIMAILWPYRPDITPGGVDLEAEIERDVLTDVADSYRPEVAAFSVRFKDIVTPFRIMGMFVMPGEATTIEVVDPDPAAQYTIEAGGGELEPVGDHAWRWRAPEEPGIYPVHVDQRDNVTTAFESTVTLNAFVMVPYELDQESLNGYRIGTYRSEPYQDNPMYQPPEGFVEVTPDVEQVLVSPHFTLGQFLCKQVDPYPKYLLLKEELLLKLEMVLREINERGIHTPSLHVMSAFRTPFYNRLIGNTTSYSQHLYGGAADIFVDTDDDSYMDDLTDDGDVTAADAVFMAEIVDDQRGEPWYEPLTGGLGVYEPTPHRGPFIHVDVRGEPVRW